MAPRLEVVIPVRAPTDVLLKTARSLAAQTERSFSVLLSDNGSGEESSVVRETVQILETSGLATRVIRPPEELGRVEHWNWSHRQAAADWVKPLFVGDWLEPEYAAIVGRAIENNAGAEIVNCNFRSHHPDGTTTQTSYTGGLHSREEVLAQACRVGNDFGGPINICFRKLAFEMVGGYPPALPVSADFWLILMLALRKGLVTCPEVLANFNFHPTRFTTNFPYHRINGDRELVVILLAATSLANFTEIPAPVSLRNRFFGVLAKRRIKGWLKQLRG
jgi:hypothetical protein